MFAMKNKGDNTISWRRENDAVSSRWWQYHYITFVVSNKKSKQNSTWKARVVETSSNLRTSCGYFLPLKTITTDVFKTYRLMGVKGNTSFPDRIIFITISTINSQTSCPVELLRSRSVTANLVTCFPKMARKGNTFVVTKIEAPRVFYNCSKQAVMSPLPLNMQIWRFLILFKLKYINMCGIRQEHSKHNCTYVQRFCWQ